MVSAGRDGSSAGRSYDGYLQLENGVGMLRLLFNEFEEAFGKLTGDDRVEELSVATAKLAYPYIDRMARRMQEKYPGVEDPYVLYQK